MENPFLENPLLEKVEQNGGLRGLCPRVEPKFCSLFSRSNEKRGGAKTRHCPSGVEKDQKSMKWGGGGLRGFTPVKSGFSNVIIYGDEFERRI